MILNWLILFFLFLCTKLAFHIKILYLCARFASAKLGGTSADSNTFGLLRFAPTLHFDSQQSTDN